MREAILAIRLEHELTKNQILEDYLNLVYFGNGAYGVQAAAERYFPKTPLAKLDLAQVGAARRARSRRPRRSNPIKHPDAAARRRSEVLDAMVANDKTTAAQARAAKSVPLPTHAVATRTRRRRDYYIDEVMQQLLDRRPERSRRSRRGARRDASRRARERGVPRRAEDLHHVRPVRCSSQADTAVRTVLPKNDAVHRVARRHRQSPTAACARSRTVARSRRCSSTPRPKGRAARPVRRSRRSRSPPR